MSILIEGMELPKNEPLLVKINPDGSVSKLWRDVFLEYANCKAIPVPPHGRLIDADYQKRTLCAECTLYPDKCLENTGDGCDWHSIAHLRMCPTIIPAEEGET